MQRAKSLERYLVLFIPWGLSLILSSNAAFSYFIAWLGSLFIFYLSMTGWVKPIPKDKSVPEQIMRPLFLVQIIFAGYMACTSIFYFLNAIGYIDFQKVNTIYFSVDKLHLEEIAQCQRYYVLAHAAFTSGVIAFMNYPVKQRFYIEDYKLANILFITAIIALPLSVLFLKVPGLSQFSNQFSSLSFIAGTLALAFAIPQKKIWNTVFCMLLYLSNFYQALTSGFKEPIIISVLVLGIFLYPNYKKIVILTFVPALILLFVWLPTYNRVFRQNAWSDNVNADDAYKTALDATINSDKGGDTNWDFLVNRLSEVDMFTTFVKSTPKNVDFYGLQLIKQSAIALVPRIFWPSKPITEELVMQRVYDAGVVYSGSNVSAKPAFVVDAYLSGGTFGVFFYLFIYGAVAQLISLEAEKLFGGYTLGIALIFTGLFQIMWRGLSFEFLINSVFYSYVSMLVIFRILRYFDVLKQL